MKKIKIKGRSFFTSVDDEDFEFLNRFDWWGLRGRTNNTWYAWTNIEGKLVLMHKLLMPGVPYIDHKNNKGLDNQKSNLRPATCSQNGQNSRKQNKITTSIYKGVCYVTDRCKWRAKLNLEGKQYHLGFYDNQVDAAKAYNKKAKQLFGEFAKLNEIKENDGTIH